MRGPWERVPGGPEGRQGPGGAQGQAWHGRVKEAAPLTGPGCSAGFHFEGAWESQRL